jgi:DNA-binding NtrC family response regulator/tetratricopeptide (TPR) repeat protein
MSPTDTNPPTQGEQWRSSAPISVDSWIAGECAPFAAIKAHDFSRYADLVQKAQAKGFKPVVIDAGASPALCYEALAETSEGVSPALDLGPQGRAIAVRLGRSIRAVAGMTATVPRRREGVAMLASRLVHHVLTQSDHLLVLDLRAQPDAKNLIRRFAEPWLNSSTARFLERGAKVSGRVALVVPSDSDAMLPSLSFPDQASDDALAGFLARNLDAVAAVLWDQLSSESQKVWRVLDALSRPVSSKPLAALVRMPQKKLLNAIDTLESHGIIRRQEEVLHLIVKIPEATSADSDDAGELIEGLTAQMRFGRDIDAGLDLSRLAPEVLVEDEQLHELVPEIVRGLRAEWRHNDALSLVRCVPDSFEAKVELSRTLLDLGRDTEAIEAIESLVGVDGISSGHVLRSLCREALIAQSIGVLAALTPYHEILPGQLQSVLIAHEMYNQGEAKTAARLLEGVEGPEASLVRSRALLADHRYHEARIALQELSSFQSFDDVVARIRANLAITEIGLGRYENAARELRAVLGLFDETAHELEGALTLGNLGIALEYLGSYQEAESAFIESIARMAVRPLFHGRIRNLIALGELQSTLGRFEQARKNLNIAADTAESIEHSGLQLDAKIRLASTYFDEGLITAARGHLKKCADFSDVSEEAYARMQVLELKCALFAGEDLLNDPGEAPADWAPSTRTQWALARGWWAAYRAPETAVGLLEDLRVKADESGDLALRWESRLLLAAALNRLGSVDGAMKFTQEGLSVLDSISASLSPNDRISFMKRPFVKKLSTLSNEIPEAAKDPTLEMPAVQGGRVPSKPTGRLIGKSAGLLESLAFAERYAETDAPVLIQGESGTGKELVAELIHIWSPRSQKALVRVNAAAISETLLLSELFGHERGAFTGAERRKAGKFEMAAGGTLFLDEIGDISPSAQVALLRVLQDGAFNRVGGNESISSDVRVIVATNRDLKALVDEGSFRLDLYYRISGLSLNIPPLRERAGDFPILVADLLRELSKGRDGVIMDPAALRLLKRHSWPGNVRELRNVLQRLMHLADAGRITVEMVQAYGPAVVASKSSDVEALRWEPGPGFSMTRVHRQVEIEYIKKALVQSKGNIAAAARLLGMTRPKLSRKVKEYGLK